MDIEFVKSVLGLLIALIPLIILIVTILNRTYRTNQPLDSKSLRVINIVRHEFDKKQWDRISINTLCFFFLALGTSLLFYIFLFYNIDIYYHWIPNFYSLYDIVFNSSLEDQYLILHIQTFIGSLFYILFFIVFLRQMALYFSKSVRKYMIYDMFANCELVVETNYKYVFNKSLETLRIMRFKVTEADEKEGYLEAFQLTFFVWIRMIQIHIAEIQNSENFYNITVFGLTEPIIFAHRIVGTNTKDINRFVDILISKSKTTEDQDNK